MDSFGNNLKNLRKSWGESQLDLAGTLGTEVSTISQWENGKRTPNNELLKVIALHYQVTIDDLLNGDFSEIPSMLDYFVNLKEAGDEVIKASRRLFPIFTTELEKEDVNFVKALEIQRKFMKGDGKIVNSLDFELMLDIYTDLLDKGGYPSVRANFLSLCFVIADMNLVSTYIDELDIYLTDDSGKNIRKDAKFLISNYILNKSELESYQDDSIFKVEEFNEIILPIIEELKKDKLFYKVADYYFALRYLYCLADNELSQVLSQQFGFHLLLDLEKINNPFAKRYLKFVKKMFKN